jgi:hypothetical protein
MIFRVLDIETVVDDSCWARGAPKYEMRPGMGPESIFLREVDPMPPPHACRVVAISWVDVTFDASLPGRYAFANCWTDCRWSGNPEEADVLERELLERFVGEMRDLITLVTWNGRQFDLPVLALRSLRHKLAAGWYYKGKDVRYRYSAEGHLDLMDHLGDFGATRFMRMGDIARLCGLPGKTDMSGDQVAPLHARALADPSVDAELRRRVARYCLQDSLQEALIFLRTRHFFGKIDSEQHDLALETFRQSPVVCSAIDVDWPKLRLTA